MNEKQKKDFVENYGITDPKPVIEKYQKMDDQVEEVMNRQIAELKTEIARGETFKKSQKFLKDHPKK